MLLVAGLAAVALSTGAFLGFRGRGLHPERGDQLFGIKPAATGFAVVELFTSEGCSSCPPADALVAQVQKEDKDQPVYVLAFHVDYWDRLGWKDAFSDAAYSDRQKDYARWLRLSSIYTPEIVVNGRTEFVGSDGRALRAAITGGLWEPAGAKVTLDAVKGSGGHLTWQAGTEAVAGGKDWRLVVAVVEKDAMTKVMAGENVGKTLAHVQIVRALGVSELNGKGSQSGSLAWPEGLKAGDAEVIAFLQNRANGKILAATRSAVAE